LTGPISDKKNAGTTTGNHESTAVQPQGLSSAGVSSLGVGEKKLVAEKMMDANGTARMKGVSTSEVGVRGREGFGACRRGTIEKRVRRSARPIASGMARGSSTARDGRDGRSWRRGVRVWTMSKGLEVRCEL
jgi:hypothetical protein